jgi:hypothetical protein
MHIDLSDDETAAVLRLLRETINDDAIRSRLEFAPFRRSSTNSIPPPAREPLPPLRNYEPPRFVRGKADGAGETLPRPPTPRRSITAIVW